jgi:hypothetical protein
MMEILLLNTLYKFQVVHSLPGRIRLHIPPIKKIPQKWHLESSYFELAKRIKGITKLEVCFLTGNALILYDTKITSEQDIINNFKELGKLALQHKTYFEKFSFEQKDELIEEFIKLSKSKYDFIE